MALAHIYQFDSFTSTAVSILPSMGQDTSKYLECKFSSYGLSLCFTSAFCNSNQRYLLSLRQASDVFTSSRCRSTQLYVTESLLLKFVLKIEVNCIQSSLSSNIVLMHIFCWDASRKLRSAAPTRQMKCWMQGTNGV